MHKYEGPRSYTVTLTVKDDEGLKGTYSATIEVKPSYETYLAIGGLLIVVVMVVTAAVILYRVKRRP